MKQTSIIVTFFVVFLLCTSCMAKKEKPKAKPPVPVKVVQAVQKDVPVLVKAIGNIEAYTSVAIKSQVGGQIARLHFAEGSDVEKGALLISIDPEPFQATLHQFEAALAKDQAQAKFAREQSERYAGSTRNRSRRRYTNLRPPWQRIRPRLNSLANSRSATQGYSRRESLLTINMTCCDRMPNPWLQPWLPIVPP